MTSVWQTASDWFFYRLQKDSLIARTVSACCESQPIGVRRPWSLTSDSPLRSDWTFTHQSSAILSFSGTAFSNCVPEITCLQQINVLCILSASGRAVFLTSLSPGRGGSTLLAICQMQIIPDLSRNRATLTYDSLALSRVMRKPELLRKHTSFKMSSVLEPKGEHLSSGRL